MKRKVIKNILWGSLSLATFSYSSCSSTKNTAPNKERINALGIDSPIEVFNDSLLNIVVNVDSIFIYELCSPLIVSDSIGTEIGIDTIANFKMNKQSIVISNEMISILKFIVGEKRLYQEDSPIAKQPYSPYVAIEFNKTDERLFLLYSFSTNQVAFATKEEILQTCKMRDWYSLERWCHHILPKNEYINSKMNER